MITEKEIWDIINSPNFTYDEERSNSYKCTIHKDGPGCDMKYVYGKTLFEAAKDLYETIHVFRNKDLKEFKDNSQLAKANFWLTKYLHDYIQEDEIFGYDIDMDALLRDLNYYVKNEKEKTNI